MTSVNSKTRLEDEKREVPPAIRKILEWDVKITKNLVAYLLNFVAVRSLQVHCRFLEISCHGILWLSSWLAFCYLINNKDLYPMQVNMIIGLLLDIVFVALIKAATRRRRPTMNDDIFSIGPDKFSFPSGHASRSFYLLCFFTSLYPLPWIFWPPLFAWSFSVSFSRILMYKHHLLDVFGGMLLGILEAGLLSILWLGPTASTWLITFLSEDYEPTGAEENT